MAKNTASRSQLEHLWKLRWQARTDLIWLCNNVLDYDLVAELTHGPMVRHLQQFPLPPEEIARESDKILPNGQFLYTPMVDAYKMDGGLGRKRLILFSRGRHKTTINTIAHTIQWLLNFPQLTLATFFSQDGKAQDILKAIKEHFQYNRKLRELFPDYCPRTRIADFGNSESFILPNRIALLERMNLPPRVEPSVMSQSLDKGQAGYHFDVIKCSDVVEEKNVQTLAQRNQVKKRVGLIPKLLVKRMDGYDGWIDIEGTFYHSDDLHSFMVEQWRKADPATRTWSIFVSGVFERDVSPAQCEKIGISPEGRPKYDPDEMLLPFKLDENGKRISTWPLADPIHKLELEENDPLEGGVVFAYQRVLDVYADKTTHRPFRAGAVWKKRADFDKVPIAYNIVSVDLADTATAKSNPTVITVAGFDRRGRCYVHHIERGRWDVDEQLDRIFAVNSRFRPLKICIEDYAYTHGLKPSLERKKQLESMRMGEPVNPPFHFVTPDRTKSKITRIINALQPPFNSGELVFIDPLNTGDDAAEIQQVLELELRDCTQTSTGGSDDILDTLAYLYICREWFGDEGLRGGILQSEAARERIRAEQYEKAWRDMLFPENSDQAINDHYKSSTGW